MRPSFNEYFMRIAKVVATRSTCLDKQVGCVLVDQDMHVISCGYNGVPSKAAHCTDLGSCAKEMGEPCRAQHAEINALMHMTGRPVLCYCTLEPCEGCAKMLRNAGVEAVYFLYKTSKSGKDAFGKHWEQLHCQGNYDPVLEVLKNITGYHCDLGYPIISGQNKDLNATQLTQARELCLAMQVELSEVVNSFDWKPWKGYNGKPSMNSDNFLEELGDLIFFMDSLLMNFGFTWGDLFERIGAKLEENYARIESGYHN